jgi:hypothetical protein
MKKIINYFALFLIIQGIISCGAIATSDNKIVEKFRKTTTEDGLTTYEDFFSKLAGLRGEVKYSVFTAEGESDPNIKIIQIDIDKKDKSVEYRTAKIQYQFNEENGFIKMAYLETNNKPQNILMGSMNLGLMMMESHLK